jgi:2-dehydropantoate 2-reductase
MRIAVLGAGAIGAYVGAALHRGGAQVYLICRGAQLDAVRAHGVRVSSPRGDFEAAVPATDDPSDVGPVDSVFLGMKAYSYAGAGKMLEPLLHDRTSVVAAQNGIPWWYFYHFGGRHEGRRIEAVDPGGAVTAAIPPWRAIGCVVYCSSELESPGVVRHLEGTRFSIGEPDGQVTPRCEELAEAMVAGGLKCPIERDLRREIWLKLIGNIAFNPLSVLTGATMAQLLERKTTLELVVAMMEETLGIARGLGSEPTVPLERRIEGARRAGPHKTSMLVDYENGKPLELDAIMKAPIELAQLVGAAVPRLQAIYAATEMLAASRAGAQK